MKQEEITRARQMDLLTYLRRYEPEELVHFSGSTYCTRTHDSLKISNGMWYWWSRGIGGRSALDYLIKVEGLEFRQAVEILAGAPQPSVAERMERQKKKTVQWIQLPPRHADNRRVFAVLRKPLARRVVQKKTYVDNGEIKTPFAIIGVRSANCTNKQREVIQSERHK